MIKKMFFNKGHTRNANLQEQNELPVVRLRSRQRPFLVATIKAIRGNKISVLNFWQNCKTWKYFLPFLPERFAYKVSTNIFKPISFENSFSHKQFSDSICIQLRHQRETMLMLFTWLFPFIASSYDNQFAGLKCKIARKADGDEIKKCFSLVESWK